ncbi:TPA: CPBP family intramembrane metalloprotease [Pseudomonas aeruginosa]|nr:CPBP family intramembrane metalloprotease [Pseudomonas aeruginosa]HCG1007985.1 CPBP family intramembrane metalloprotease [Pseudomonas aeruginosa]
MWFLLATSLLALSFQRLLALALLLATCCLAFYDGVLAPPAVAALAALGVLALLRRRLAARRAWALGLELLLVAGAVGLFLHLLPGFANPRVLDKAVVGPQSLPFTMYFNFDKALVPFLLLACLPSLFRDEARAPGRPWYWLLLVAAVPALLLLAVGVGLLRPELHAPAWLWQFILANLFFVSLAEEALFRSYLQQRLGQWLGPWPALALASALFGLAHFAGGPLLMLFAGLAGLIYGLAWLWSGRLWVATLFHFGLNLTHLLLFTYPLYRPA